MVISDFIILVPMQRIRTKFRSPKTQCICHLQSVCRTRNQMQWGYRLFDSIGAMRYTLYPDGDLIYSQPFFDAKIEVADANRYECKVIVQGQWEKTVVDIINFYLDNSPAGIIGVLFRLDDVEEERVFGVYKKPEFIETLKNGELYFNKEYFVSNHRG